MRMSETVFSLGLLIEVFKRDPVMIVEQVKNRHGGTARRTSDRIIAEGRDDGSSPGSERGKGLTLLFGDGPADASIRLAMASIDAIITDHFKMLFGDVPHKSFDEIHSGNSFMDKDIIFVSVVVEGNGIRSLVIGIDTGSGDHRTAEVAADIVEDSGRAAFVAFGINVETVFRVAINGSFETFEFRWETILEQIEEDGLEGMTEEGIIEVRNRAPKTEFIDTAFRDKAVNVGVPF